MSSLHPRTGASLAVLAVALLGGVSQGASKNAADSELNSKDVFHQDQNRDAFTRPAPALNSAQLRVFNFGNRIFNTNWVVAPASSNGFDGLGPLFNRVSCSGCHLRDGRGRPPIAGESELLSALVRISLKQSNAGAAPKPVPNYGTQISDRAIPGVAPEATIAIRWQESIGKYADGETYQLRKPIIELKDANYGELPKQIETSLRVAPAVIGLGLLEAVPDATLRALADPNDANKDGISGRINQVYSPHFKKLMLGRFGWKANAATLMDQNLDAALGDIGLTSNHSPRENCTDKQSECLQAPNGGTPELNANFASKLTQYVQMLGVPQPRALDETGTRGRNLFRSMQCAQCHVEQLETGAADFTFLQKQRFQAYTDLLLHDMGEGLSDGRSDHHATAREWRTPPLWGIGLVNTVNYHTLFLHDGRARGLAEAILWHDGEAKAAKEAFRNAPKPDREALLAFLNSL
jgi:CxxC motif-containing protein (DUF1111 family)